MDRGQLIESVVRGVEERLVPGASEVVSDLSSLVPDRPGAPDVPGIPDWSGRMPQAPGLPQRPEVPQVPGMPDRSGLMPHAPGLPRMPEVPQAPGMPDAAQNGLDQFDRARQWGDRVHGANGTLHPDERHPESVRAAHREVAADGFADAIESEDEPQRERTPFAQDEEHATAVLRVCRNGWNVLDTRAVGGHWWSA